MEISRSHQTRVKRSYRLANTSVTHIVSNRTAATLSLASNPLEQQSPTTDPLFEMLITVDSIHITNLRQVASEACGESIDSFEIQPTKKPMQYSVRLRCFGKATITRVMSAVISQLECAEFGHVHPV